MPVTTVAKVIELVGESAVSWDDAMRNAVEEASKRWTISPG